MRSQKRPAAKKTNAGKAGHERRIPQPNYIEGRRACIEALTIGAPIKKAFLASGDSALSDLAKSIAKAGIPLQIVERRELDKISYRGSHQGIVCELAPFHYASLHDLIVKAKTQNELIVLLDHVVDEGNLGAIVRSAEVVGACGVVIAKARAAAIGSGAYKSSAGAVLHIPIAQVSNIATAATELQKAGFWVACASEHAAQSVWEAPLYGRIALVMGSEEKGVSRLVRDVADFSCRLPQRGHIESLNVAQAATVMCYEWLRRSTESKVQ